MPRAMAVLRMEWPRKLALSNTMVVVSSVISLFAPPITPASATGLVRVGNDEHAGRESVVVAVERPEIRPLRRGGR